jgi:hypothetical protein
VRARAAVWSSRRSTRRHPRTSAPRRRAGRCTAGCWFTSTKRHLPVSIASRSTPTPRSIRALESTAPPRRWACTSSDYASCSSEQRARSRRPGCSGRCSNARRRSAGSSRRCRTGRSRSLTSYPAGTRTNTPNSSNSGRRASGMPGRRTTLLYVAGLRKPQQAPARRPNLGRESHPLPRSAPSPPQRRRQAIERVLRRRSQAADRIVRPERLTHVRGVCEGVDRTDRCLVSVFARPVRVYDLHTDGSSVSRLALGLRLRGRRRGRQVAGGVDHRAARTRRCSRRRRGARRGGASAGLAATRMGIGRSGGGSRTVSRALTTPRARDCSQLRALRTAARELESGALLQGRLRP